MPSLSPKQMQGLPVKEIRKGRQYSEALEAVGEMNFSAGIWYFVHPMGDRFGPEMNPDFVTCEQAIEFLYRIGVKAISWHYPGEFNQKNAALIGGMLAERKMRVGSIAANTFSDVVWRWGGPACHIPSVRAFSLKLNMDAQKLCERFGCHHQTDWAGRDGFDGTLLYETDKQWAWTREAYVAILEHVRGKVGFAIEFKPYDAMEHSVLKNIDDALRMCHEVEDAIRQKLARQVKRDLGPKATQTAFERELKKRFKPYDHSMGINIEDAHVYLSGQRVAEAVLKSITEDRLFLRHENDCEGRIDNDLIFGSLHFWDALESTYYQLVHGFDAKGYFHEPDIFPQRDDPLKAYIASLNSILFFYALARKLVESANQEKLRQIMDAKQASGAMDFLLGLVARGVSYRKIPLSLADTFRKDVC